MNNAELENYCHAGKTTLDYSLATNSKFKNNFYLRSFTTGCYFYDFTQSKWSSRGMEVGSDTNTLYTHCIASHLTTFSGGLTVLPPSIDFAYVFANASFTKNLTVYITIIVVTAFFILMCILARYMDKSDNLKIGFALAPDNKFSDTYFYEISVYTGHRKGAGTDSKVKFLLSGFFGDTGIRCLNDTNRKPFRRGGIDSFIMSHNIHLGKVYLLIKRTLGLSYSL